MMQCVAVCCSVLQCVRALRGRCQILQVNESCCRVLQCVAVCCIVLLLLGQFQILQVDVSFCRSLQWVVAVRCSVRQGDAVSAWYSPVSPNSDPAGANIVSCRGLQCPAVCCRVLQCCAMCWSEHMAMGWIRLVGSLKLQVTCVEYRLFHRALLQKRPTILRSPLLVATPYRQKSPTSDSADEDVGWLRLVGSWKL